MCLDRKDQKPAQRLYDLKDAALYLGRPVWSLRELIWSGQLPFVRSGRKLYVDLGDLNDFIEKHKERNLEACRRSI